MNLPNKLTMLRIILIPFFMFFYLATFIPGGKIIATVILILAALTDMLDGRIARKYNLITDFGKLMDPVADKSFSLTALILLAVDKTIASPFGAIVLVLFLLRDFVVSGLRQIAAAKSVVIAADKWGKIKSVVLDVSLPIFFVLAYLTQDLALSVSGWVLGIYVFAYVLLGISTVLTVYSGINYLIKNKHMLK
jgi:CDP-diacylglycerol--glycerol-3-phosphate 3-phosphatidyltransferase